MSNTIYCSRCKNENELDANFCIFCGDKLLTALTRRNLARSINASIQYRSTGFTLNHYYALIQSNSLLIIGAAALLAFITIGSEYNLANWIRNTIGINAGKHSSKLQDKSAELCDRMAILKRCNEMILNDDSRSCLDLSNRFFESCGEYDQLYNYRNIAARRLSEWQIALDSANKLVDLYPLAANPHFIRAQTYNEKGDFPAAISEYEQTLTLMPAEMQTPFELANLYQRINQPCSGIPPLEQYSHLHPDAAKNAEQMLSILYKNPQCAEMQGKGKGKAKIRMNKQGAAIISKVIINNQQGNFIVDTGATLVTLSKGFADRLKLNYSGWPKMLTQTANGIGVAYRGYVDTISLQGLEAKHIEVAIAEEIGTSDGLLGLSFLNRFKIELDSDKGYMVLTARSG